jgi:hypothetical protein
VEELYDGTNITKLSHHDDKFTEEINQLINQLINLFQIKCCDVNLQQKIASKIPVKKYYDP